MERKPSRRLFMKRASSGAAAIAFGLSGCLSDEEPSPQDNQEGSDSDEEGMESDEEEMSEPEPAQFEVQNIRLEDGGVGVYQGEMIKLVTEVRNTGGTEGSTTVELHGIGFEELDVSRSITTNNISPGEVHEPWWEFPMHPDASVGTRNLEVTETATGDSLTGEIEMLELSDTLAVTDMERLENDLPGTIGTDDISFEISNTQNADIDHWDEISIEVEFLDSRGRIVGTETISGTPPRKDAPAVLRENLIHSKDIFEGYMQAFRSGDVQVTSATAYYGTGVTAEKSGGI